MKIRWAMGNGRMVIFRSSARVVKGMVFKAFLWYTVFHLSCIRKPVSYVYYSEISKFLQGFQFWFFAKFQRGFVRFFDLILRGTLRAFYRIWGFHGNFRNSDKFWQDFGFFLKVFFEFLRTCAGFLEYIHPSYRKLRRQITNHIHIDYSQELVAFLILIRDECFQLQFFDRTLSKVYNYCAFSSANKLNSPYNR
jgi:hypothetical protein